MSISIILLITVIIATIAASVCFVALERVDGQSAMLSSELLDAYELLSKMTTEGSEEPTFDLKVIMRDDTTYLIEDATSYVFKYRDGYDRNIELLQVYKDGNEGNKPFAVFVYDEVSAVIKEDD